ncbi:MAG: hypothetical protein ACRDRP_06375 [Pseudonocardiaceae bacterium]
MFWIIDSYERCQKILAADAPAHLQCDTELRLPALRESAVSIAACARLGRWI